MFRIDRRLVKVSDVKLDKFDTDENTEVGAEGEVPDAATSAEPMYSADDVINDYINAAKSETEAKIEAILEGARTQAETIISDARVEAEEERERARKEGFEEGLKEGTEEGRRSFDQELANKIREDDEKLQNVLSALNDEKERMLAELEDEVIGLSLEIIKKIFNPPEETLREMFLMQLKNALRQMSTDGKIIIRVGPAEYERFFSSGAATIELDSGITVHASVIRDVSLNEGDLIIDTDDVTVNAGLESQLQYVQIAFERANQYEPD